MSKNSKGLLRPPALVFNRDFGTLTDYGNNFPEIYGTTREQRKMLHSRIHGQSSIYGKIAASWHGDLSCINNPLGGPPSPPVETPKVFFYY